MDILKGNNYFVYILTKKTKRVLYIGVTSDIDVRVYYHKNPGLVNKIPFTTEQAASGSLSQQVYR